MEEKHLRLLEDGFIWDNPDKMLFLVQDFASYGCFEKEEYLDPYLAAHLDIYVSYKSS